MDGDASAIEDPPYADDPAIVEQIGAMGDNSAMWLGDFNYAGDRVEEWRERYGRAPQRRDYSNKLAYAPDRETALYVGANHGTPHKLNDAWEYHLGSNTWHLLFFPDEQYHTYYQTPGGPSEHLMIDEGYLQTQRHGPVSISHTWDGLSYDPGQRRLMWANVYGIGDVINETTSALAHYADDTGQDYETLVSQLAPATNLWMYDLAAGRWFKQTAANDGPRPSMVVQGGALEYIPDLGRFLWYANDWYESGMWLYDSSANTWEELEPNNGAPMYTSDYGAGPFPPAEAQLRYSERHRTAVAVRGGTTWHYSFDANEWSKVVENETANDAHDANTVFVYDNHNDVFLLVQPALGTLRAYDIETRTWETLVPDAAGAEFPGVKTAGYFDTQRNVLVVYDHVAGRPWLYRYRRR